MSDRDAGEDFQLIEVSFVPIEWVEKMYPSPSRVGRMVPERDACGYCFKSFSVTVPNRQLVCVTEGCPARSEWRGPVEGSDG